MKSIIFIIPYFGDFSNYFNLWLESCKANSTINWLILTDNEKKYGYPSNVKVKHISFKELCAKFQSHFEFKLALKKPYKLCDFRPAFGDVFYDYIKKYDFWGYCDTDLIWGNMRKFLTDNLLDKYEKIGSRGHCCIIRNTEKMRKAYLYDSSTMVTYRDVFSSPKAFCFDEQKGFGKYCIENDVMTYDNFCFFDVSIMHDDYRVPYYEKDLFEYMAHNIFEYRNGSLFLLWVKYGSSKLNRKEIMYVHFQKRLMTVNIKNIASSNFFIYGDSFNTCMHDLKAEDVKRLDPKSIKRTLYIKVMWKKIKAEFLHLGGIKYYKYPY